MAPEQATGDKTRLGPWTDVFSLGVMLYELLTAKLPFRGDSPAALLFAPLSGRPVPFREYRRGLPADLEAICMKCLAAEPRDRYLTAAELADDLQRFLDGRPVMARTASAGGLAHRKPILLAAGIVLLGLLGGGLALTTALYLRTDQAWKSAEQLRAEAEAARSQAEPVSPPPPAMLGGIDTPSVRFDEAVQVLAEVAAQREQGLDVTNAKAVEQAIRGLMALAEVSLAVGRLDQAEQAATSAAAQAETLARGQPTVLLAQALGLKADVIVARQPEQRWRRGDAALRATRQAKDVALLAYPPGDSHVYDRIVAEVEVLTALGKTEEAQQTITQALEAHKARFGAKNPKSQELADRLSHYVPSSPAPFAPATIPMAVD
jgi:hypothetical protein